MLKSTNSPDNKASFRKKVIKMITQLPENELIKCGRTIEDKVIQTDWFRRSKSVFIYVSSSWEVSTYHLIKKALADEKKVFVPRVRSRGEMDICQLKDFNVDLEKGAFSIFEPKKECLILESYSEIDLFIIPGVAFTSSGLRMGRGGGYFDRFLAKENRGDVIALAYEIQICLDLPHESHDQGVDGVMTELNFYRS